MTHLYDGCPACLERTRSELGRVPAPVPQARPTPTAAQFEKHASRFGPESVAKTAEELGVDTDVEQPRRVRGPRRPSLKARVATLLAAGHGVDVVAELENLTPARARRVVDEVKNPNGRTRS